MIQCHKSQTDRSIITHISLENNAEIVEVINCYLEILSLVNC